MAKDRRIEALEHCVDELTSIPDGTPQGMYQLHNIYYTPVIVLYTRN